MRALKEDAQTTLAIVLDKQSLLDTRFCAVEARSIDCSQVCDDLQAMFRRDYADFVVNRKRWKSDFDAATHSANEQLKALKEIIKV